MASNDSILPRRTDESAASELQHCRCGADMSGAKLLACLHVLGTCCLKVEKRQEKEVVQCTQCLHDTLVPEGKLELLPSPTFLHNLKAAELEKEGKKPQCGMCKKDTEAVAHCQDCNEFICTTHKDVHSEMPIVKHHVILPLKESGSKPEVATQSKCRKHGIPLRFYCQDCAVAICLECKTFGLHSDHGHVELSTKLQQVDEEIRAGLEALNLNETEQTSPDAAHAAQQNKVDNLGVDLERNISVMLDEERFTRQRMKQVMESGSEEERLLLHQMLQLPNERYARVTQNRTALIYLPPAGMDTTNIRLSLPSDPPTLKTPSKKLHLCHATDEMSDEQKMQHLKVGSLFLYGGSTLLRITEVDAERQLWKVCTAHDNKHWNTLGTEHIPYFKLLDHYVPL